MEYMLDEFINKIINADCMEVLKKLPEKSIDLVVTSPPYNLKNSTGNGMKTYYNSISKTFFHERIIL